MTNRRIAKDRSGEVVSRRALFERGPTTHTNGVYNGMAIHALNALVGSMFAEGAG